MEAWESALSDEPDSIEMLTAVAATLYADGKYAQALPYLRRALELDKGDSTLRLFAATVMHLAHEDALAEKEFQAVIQGSPASGNAQIARDKSSGAYFRDESSGERSALNALGGRHEPGRLWTAQLFRIPWAPRKSNLSDSGGSVPIISACLLLGGKLVTGGDVVAVYRNVQLKAIAYADRRYIVVVRAWKGTPEEASLDALRVQLQLFEYLLDSARLGRDAMSATVVSQKLRAIDAVRTRNYGSAEALTRSRLAAAPDDPQVLVEYGTLRLIAGQGEEAADRCRSALRIWPDYADAHFCVGAALLSQKHIDEGIQQTREAIAAKPTLAEAYLNLAEGYEQQSRHAEAAAAVSAALEAAPFLEIPESLRLLTK